MRHTNEVQGSCLKNQELLAKLYEIQRLKSKAKRAVQEAFDTLHLLETTMMLLIQDIQAERKKK